MSHQFDLILWSDGFYLLYTMYKRTHTECLRLCIPVRWERCEKMCMCVSAHHRIGTRLPNRIFRSIRWLRLYKCKSNCKGLNHNNGQIGRGREGWGEIRNEGLNGNGPQKNTDKIHLWAVLGFYWNFPIPPNPTLSHQFVSPLDAQTKNVRFMRVSVCHRCFRANFLKPSHLISFYHTNDKW